MRNFTPEQLMFRDAYRRFLEAKVVPHMPRWREEGIVDRAAFRAAGAQGMLMIWPDEIYGGMGDGDFRFEQIIIEELQRADCVEFYAPLHSRLVGPYFRHGTEEQRQRFLPKCVTGETILAIAMTEPGAGSDLAGIKTQAKDMGDHFLLNGTKTYISNGINADAVIVAAKCDAADNAYAMSLLIVERGMDGFERGRNLNKMGLHGQDTAELFFDDVKVPKANLLGAAGQAFAYLMDGLAEERLMAAVGNIAAARRALDITREYVLERRVFGTRVADLQNCQFKLAALETEIEIMEVYVDHCVAMHNQGRLTPNMAAKAKLQSSEIQARAVDEGVQLHGGAGYMQEYEICRMFTDARISRILAGSSEIMKYIIGRDLISQKYSSPLA